MINLVKSSKDINSFIQKTTGYSFSVSNVSKNVSKVALPAIALGTMAFMLSNAVETATLTKDHEICYTNTTWEDREGGKVSEETMNRYMECFEKCIQTCMKLIGNQAFLTYSKDPCACVDILRSNKYYD
ncbi:MAG: hypothetical protein ACRDAI_07510 [Candidatus Rhabdochlamydia sp.]